MKVVIFGNSGSGKSTFAKKLIADHNLKHLDLDTIAWQKTSPPKRESIEVSEQKILDFTIKNPAWVIEGCYGDLLEIAVEKCDEIHFLNLDIETCKMHCRQRPWEPHKYESKDHQDKNLDMLLDWVSNYHARNDEFSLRAHRKIFDSFTGKKTEFRAPI